MPAPSQHPEPNPRQAKPTLFFVILGVIVVMIAAFLILRPHPPTAPTQESPASAH
jgi:hypothetical protein